MKKTLLLLLAFVALACSKNHSSVESEPPLKKVEHSYVMPLDSVRALALKLPSTFSDNLATKSAGKQIKEILPFSNFSKTPKTRSNDPNAPSIDDVYVVNYEDERGFAIICADKRLPDVFGYSDSGSISDTLSNPGMVMVMELIPPYIENANNGIWGIDPKDQPEEFDPNAGNGYWEYYDTKYGEWTGITKGPLLKTMWGQDKPYNLRAPISSVGHDGKVINSPAGCGATAVAMILAYHKKPNFYANGFYMYWDRINACARWYNFAPNSMEEKMISELFDAIGIAIEMNYGHKSSYTTNGKVVRGLRYLGLDNDGEYSYSFNRVKEDVNNDRPLYMGGAKADYIIDNYWNGHAWVIDGYKELTREVSKYKTTYSTIGNNTTTYSYLVSKTTEKQQLVHCNWGWDGFSNGWYLSGIFNVQSPIEKDGYGDINESMDYKYRLELIKNIR